MMNKLLSAAFLVICMSSCARIPHRAELDTLDLGNRPLAINLKVPFVTQTGINCGPSALLMAAKQHKPSLTLEDVTSLVMSPGAKGTYKQDLLAGARRLGFAPYPLNSFTEILNAVATGHPVVLFHSTAILSREYWHYSVMTGYDLRAQTVNLHIGTEPYYAMDMSKLLFNWDLGGNWAYLIVPPSELPENAKLEESIANSLVFLRLGLLKEARESSEAAVVRWPNSYEAEVTLADSLYRQNFRKDGLLHLKRAADLNPKNEVLAKKLKEFRKYSSVN